MHFRKLFSACAGLSTLAVLLSGCSNAKSSTPPPSATPTPTQVLWGDMKPIVSVKELMRYMIDPASDNIFDAVKIVQTKTGTVEKVPKTEEDWEKLRIGAVTLAEGVYLLKVPRPFAPAGDVNAQQGTAYGGVRIQGAPRDAQIFADGYYVGIVDDFDGPTQHLNLEAGVHAIEIRVGNQPPIKFDINVQAGQTITYHAGLTR